MQRLASEQDRYISQFTTMETLINQMNSQASYLAQFRGRDGRHVVSVRKGME